MSEVREWFESGRDRVVPRTPPVAPPDWLTVAVRLCRDGEDSLARRFKPVPVSHRAERGVRCVCHDLVEVPDRGFAKCPNGCRWFLRDGNGVWAAQLPSEEQGA